MRPGHPHREVTIERQKALSQQFGWTEETERPTPTTPTPGETYAFPPESSEPASVQMLAEHKRLRELVDACPHRGCKTGCGNAECNAGKGDQAGGAIASLVHCRRCVADLGEPSTTTG